MKRKHNKEVLLRDIYKRNQEHIFCTNVDGVTFILNNNTFQVYEIKGVAADIWNLLDGQRSLTSIIKTMKNSLSCSGMGEETKYLIKKLETLELVEKVLITHKPKN